MNKKVFLGVTTLLALGSAIASGVGTYRARHKIEKIVKKEVTLREGIKSIIPDYVPAAATFVGAVGCAVAGESITKKDIKRISSVKDKAVEKYKKISEWYKDQTDAIEECADEETKAKIKKTLYVREAKRSCLDEFEIKKFYDPVTRTFFESTEADIRIALNHVNKQISLTGSCAYGELYSELGICFPKEFKDFVWNDYMSIENGNDGWVDVEFVSDYYTGEGDVEIIRYITSVDNSDYTVPYEPEEDVPRC